MPRPVKKKIELTSESFTDLCQQIWSECDQQRSLGIFQYNKWNRDVKENTDIALVGKTNNELLKIIDSATNNRIQVARLINDYLKASSSPADGGGVAASSGTVSEEDKNTIFEMIQKASAANNTEYVNKEEDK